MFEMGLVCVTGCEIECARTYWLIVADAITFSIMGTYIIYLKWLKDKI